MFLFFYFFMLVGLFTAILAIFSKNTIYSILYLILVFCNASGLLFLLNVDYLAFVFLIVYVGAIAVLFLFVVMMLNVKLSARTETFSKYLPIVFLTMVILVVELRFFSNYFEVSELFAGSKHSTYMDWLGLLDKPSNIHALGQVIYTYYYIPFILSSLILLIAMIGSITLTLTTASGNSKSQQIFVQITRTSRESYSLMQVK